MRKYPKIEISGIEFDYEIKEIKEEFKGAEYTTKVAVPVIKETKKTIHPKDSLTSGMQEAIDALEGFKMGEIRLRPSNFSVNRSLKTNNGEVYKP